MAFQPRDFFGGLGTTLQGYKRALIASWDREGNVKETLLSKVEVSFHFIPNVYRFDWRDKINV